MQKFWLLDQHDGEGPTALVETDGRLRIVDVIRFGPTVTELEAQQAIWDKVQGRVAPTLKPCVKASSIDEEGVEPHPDLGRDDGAAPGTAGRGDRRQDSQSMGATEHIGGPSRTRSRGER